MNHRVHGPIGDRRSTLFDRAMLALSFLTVFWIAFAH